MLPNLMKPKTFFSIKTRRLKTEADQEHNERLQPSANRKVPRISSSCTRPNDNDHLVDRRHGSNSKQKDGTVQGLRELSIVKDVNIPIRHIRRVNKPYKKQSLSLLDNLIGNGLILYQEILRYNDKEKFDPPLQMQTKNHRKKHEPMAKTKILKSRFVDEKTKLYDTKKFDSNFPPFADNFAQQRRKMASEHTSRQNVVRLEPTRLMDADPLMTFFPVEYSRNLRVQQC